MYICFFKRKSALDGRLIKHNARTCAHRGMHQWGVNYWENYSPVVNWKSIREMLTLSILREIHTKSVDFSWTTLRLMLKTEIFM